MGKPAQEFGFPLVIRPSFTLGGTGASFVHNEDQFEKLLRRGLEASPIHEVLIDKALLGWKEYELELLRDKNDNVVIICTIENMDPMGIHTGDSYCTAPMLTIDADLQSRLQKYSYAIVEAIEGGWCPSITSGPVAGPANAWIVVSREGGFPGGTTAYLVSLAVSAALAV